MICNEKVKKICNDFSSLNDEQQDYILGILQALVFANNNQQKQEPTPSEDINSSGSE